MSSQCILYGIPNCDTVKKSRAWFDQHGSVYEFFDFKKQGVPEHALREWVAALGWEALVNKKGTTWRKLDVASQAKIIDAESAITLMMNNASVIRRPVVVHDEKITLGYVPEQW